MARRPDELADVLMRAVRSGLPGNKVSATVSNENLYVTVDFATAGIVGVVEIDKRLGSLEIYVFDIVEAARSRLRWTRPRIVPASADSRAAFSSEATLRNTPRRSSPVFYIICIIGPWAWRGGGVDSACRDGMIGVCLGHARVE